VDAGNVFLYASEFDLGRIRGSGGLGLRYKSPVGPIRLDVGFKFDRQILPSGTRERPYAVFLSLGRPVRDRWR
jgi:outer membrane translocation and assembly module TamA